MKSTKELRDFLVGQMGAVATGDVDLDRAKGVANLAQQVYNSLLIEVRIAKAKASLGENARIDPVDF